MKLRAISLAVATMGALAVAAPQVASASLVYDASILAPAQGFGSAPRDLTLQATGNATTESGGVGVATGGAITFGTVIQDSSVFMGNGMSNLSGTAAMPNPLNDDLKYGIPTSGSLGITSANQIAVLFNATEPGGDNVDVLDLTLKFYTSAGSFLGAIGVGIAMVQVDSKLMGRRTTRLRVGGPGWPSHRWNRAVGPVGASSR